jgi:hypothetical protein
LYCEANNIYTKNWLACFIKQINKISGKVLSKEIYKYFNRPKPIENKKSSEKIIATTLKKNDI